MQSLTASPRSKGRSEERPSHDGLWARLDPSTQLQSAL